MKIKVYKGLLKNQLIAFRSLSFRNLRNISAIRFFWVLLVFFYLCLVCPGQAARAKINASVDRTTALPNESIRLMVNVEGGEGEIDILAVKDFKVMPRGTSSSIRIVNNQTFREMTYNYALLPLKKGRLVIPALKVKTDGKTYYTKEIIVRVQEDDSNINQSKDVFVAAAVSAKNAFEGQQFIYTFKLFNRIRIANAKFQKPDFRGFSVKGMGDPKSSSVILEGKKYHMSQIDFILIPLDSGKKIISPAILTCDIVRQSKNRQRSFFDSFFKDDPFLQGAHLETRNYRTEPITVDIKNLPPQLDDIQFSGLVGSFHLTSSLEKNELDVSESATLSITVEGVGNIMDVELPMIKLPDSFKMYQDAPEEEISVGEKGYAGKKVFRLALVPMEEGNYELEPVRICYFNPQEEKYKVLSGEKLFLKVHEGKETENITAYNVSSTIEKPGKKEVQFTGRDILPLKEDLASLKTHRPLWMHEFLMLVFLPILMFAGIKMILKFSKKSDDPTVVMAEKSQAALKSAERMKDDDEKFLSHLYAALVSSIYSKAGRRGESLTCKEIQGILESSGVSAKTTERAQTLLIKIEADKYGGSTMNSTVKASLFTETEDLVKGLIK